MPKVQSLSKTRSIPLGNYPNGTYDRGPFATPNGLDGFDIRIGRCTSADPTIWPNATTVVTIDLQVSFDGGDTFSPLGANRAVLAGGIESQRGVEIAESIVSWRFSPDEPTHLKLQVKVEGGPIKTYMDVTINQ